MKQKAVVLITFSLLCLVSMACNVAQAATYFEWKSSDGYKYVGPQNPHPGGGFFSWMGGDPYKPSGTGCDDPLNFHNTVVSSGPDAANPVTGSLTALKTPYRGACPNESFQRDTTIVKTPLLSEYYIRWTQKWTGSFQASVQQKFVKFYNSADTKETTATAYMVMQPSGIGATTGTFRNYMPNIDGHFSKGGCNQPYGKVWVQPAPFSCSQGQISSWDDSDSTISPVTFSLNRWYSIEIHSKLNSTPSSSDGAYEVWVDGVLRFAAYNLKFRDGLTFNTPGTNNFEFQHVYYNRSNQDQTTYMDNIIISDHYNGPIRSQLSPPTRVAVW